MTRVLGEKDSAWWVPQQHVLCELQESAIRHAQLDLQRLWQEKGSKLKETLGADVTLNDMFYTVSLVGDGAGGGACVVWAEPGDYGSPCCLDIIYVLVWTCWALSSVASSWQLLQHLPNQAQQPLLQTLIWQAQYCRYNHPGSLCECCHAINAILLHKHTHSHLHLLSSGSCSGCRCSPVRSTGFTALALSRTHDCLLVVNKVQGAVTQVQHPEATNFRPQQQHRQLYTCALTLPPTTPAAPAAAVSFCLVSC